MNNKEIEAKKAELMERARESMDAYGKPPKYLCHPDEPAIMDKTQLRGVNSMKALDIVRTPKGGIAFITETNNEGKQASIKYIGDLNPGNERGAWWDESELEVIDSLPKMIAMATCHPFGRGESDVKKFF